MPKLNVVSDIIFSLWENAFLANQKAESPALIKPPITVLLLGPPGIGKTSMARQLAKRMTDYVRKLEGVEARPALCEVKDLSSSLPEDLNGLPKTDGEVMRFVPDSWLHRLCQPDAYGVLVLDDLPAASLSVQVAARQISLDHRAHEHIINQNVIIIVTGNRRTDKSAASNLPAHFLNSVLQLDIDTDLDGWLEWYGGQGLDPIVPAYLLYRTSNFSKLPKDADARGVFATPRTWAMLGQTLPVARKVGAVLNVAQGLVGEGIAAEFNAFVQIADQLVDPRKVLANPEAAIPDVDALANQTDRMLATLTGICDVAVRENSQAMLGKLWSAIAYLCQKRYDFVTVAVQTYKANGGNVRQMTTVLAKLRDKDPRVRSLCDRMSEGLDIHRT